MMIALLPFVLLAAVHAEECVAGAHPQQECVQAPSMLQQGKSVKQHSSKASGQGSKPRGQFKVIADVPVLHYDKAYENEIQVAGVETQGEWNVVLSKQATPAQVQHMCKALPDGCKLTGHPQGGFSFVEIRASESELERALSVEPGLARFVEPDQTVQMIPEIKSSDMQSTAATWGLNRIGADQRSQSGAGVTIFIVDTGVRSSHHEFGGRAASALDVSSGSLVECRGNAACAGDGQGHGTHCAGSASGITYGVAPSAAVRSVKVLNDQGSGSWSWTYSALDWLALQQVRPKVASLSLGGRGQQSAMTDAVDAAVDAGVVVVVAGGNSNNDACQYSPAFVASAITVGSTTDRDYRSGFSNYGRCTNIWAPGSSVVSAGVMSDTSTATLSGTSMACPHVSGGAALVLAANPGFTSQQVLAELQSNAFSNVINGLTASDTNRLLWVGAGAAPPSPTVAPAPPPGAGCDPATSSGPDSDGDCKCNRGLACHESGHLGCTYSFTGPNGWKSGRWYLPSCSSCECRAR